MCPTVSKMGVCLQHFHSWCARWRILRHGDFVTISKLRNECMGLRNGTRVPKGGFTTAKHPSKWRFGCEMEDLQGVEVSQPFRSCETGVLGCEMALVCQRTSSQLWKFSQRRMGGCETISQQEAIFAASHFRLRNFADHALSLLLSSSWFPTSLFHLFWHSSWFWSSKNLCYIKTN